MLVIYNGGIFYNCELERNFERKRKIYTTTKRKA